MAVKKKKQITPPVATEAIVPEEDALPVENVELENTEENPEEESKTGSLLKNFFIWSGIAIVIGAVLGVSWKLAYERGIIVGQQQMQEKQEKESIMQKEVEITPTPKEDIKSTYTIEVLNGSGISGEAVRIKTLLEKEGFTVSAVGNASESDNEETIIQAKSSVSKAWIESVKKVLGESLVVSELTSLEDEESTDVIITVGNKKAE